MRRLSLLCSGFVWLGALLLDTSVAFTVSNGSQTRPLSSLSRRRQNTPLVANAAADAAVSSPLFGRVQETRVSRWTHHSVRSIWKRIRRVFLILSLALIWRGGLLPPTAMATRGDAVASQAGSRVVPVVAVVAAATGAGLFLGKKYDSGKKDDKEDKNDTIETVVVVEEEALVEDEDIDATSEEEEESEETLLTCVEAAKAADKLRAQHLIEKTLRDVKEAELRALERSKHPEPARPSNASKDDVVQTSKSLTSESEDAPPEIEQPEKIESPAATPKAPISVEVEETEKTVKVPDAVSVTESKYAATSKAPISVEVEETEKTVNVSDAVSDTESKSAATPKAPISVKVEDTEKIVKVPDAGRVSDTESKSAATPSKAPIFVEFEVTEESVKAPDKVADTESKEVLQAAGKASQQTDPPTQTTQDLEAKYNSIASVEEKAFSILVDLGMVEFTPDPEDPSYDHSHDNDLAECRSKN